MCLGAHLLFWQLAGYLVIARSPRRRGNPFLRCLQEGKRIIFCEKAPGVDLHTGCSISVKEILQIIEEFFDFGSGGALVQTVIQLA